MGKASAPSLSCKTCTRVKRKCSRELPSCLRCRSRDLACEYPLPKPSNYVRLEDDVASDGPKETLDARSSLINTVAASKELKDGSTFGTRVPTPEHHSSPGISWWFDSPETWLIDQVPGAVKLSPPSLADMDAASTTMRHWLDRWAKDERNPIFHHELYRMHFPSCLQDAFLLWTCCSGEAGGIRNTVRRILDDKATTLVNGKLENLSNIGILERLARCQALLVYQIISLFNSDLVLRSLAEQHIPVLTQWLHELIDIARMHDNLGACFGGPENSPTNKMCTWEEESWHSWIVAESIRRTWLAVSMIQGMYLHRQDGVHHCLGGMMFTSRSGFWNALTAAAWQQRCTDVYGGLVRLTEMNKLLSNIELKDMDEFAKLVLKMTFGSDQMRNWLMP